MIANDHQKLADFIWSIANKLRGPYRPPQYRKVMLPLIVLRRLDCVLEATKDEVLKKYAALKHKGLSQTAIEKALAKTASKDRDQPLHNISRYTFQKLLGDPDGLSRNLTAYIKGFSTKVREIFERFEFEAEIEKLDGANRLFEIIKEFSAIDLHPENVSNIEMGYVFENLIRRFNEQANEEAGDHFTPREVIRLMAHLIYTDENEIYKPGISRTIYDPTCGTGGMLSVSEEYIRQHNPQAHLTPTVKTITRKLMPFAALTCSSRMSPSTTSSLATRSGTARLLMATLARPSITCALTVMARIPRARARGGAERRAPRSDRPLNAVV